jgi:hypothetical protein
MASNLLEQDVTSVLTATVERSAEELWIVNPTHRTIEAAVDVASEVDGALPTMRLLADEAALKTTFDDFLVASRTADLIDAGQLAVRTLDDDSTNSLVVADDAVFALVTATDRVAALSTDDDEFVDEAKTACVDRWEDADAFQLRTPPISRVRGTLTDDIGEAAREDFDAVLASLDTARGDGNGLDEVTTSLLIAARNEVLLYDISKWGEDVGIASKATFSRTKTQLENTGLITTEKVPIDVGRPRLRLQLADDRLSEADPDEFGRVVDEIRG